MSDKDSINKDTTSARDGAREGVFDIAGNVREKGQDPSPGDRDRGERSDAEPKGAGGAGGARHS